MGEFVGIAAGLAVVGFAVGADVVGDSVGLAVGLAVVGLAEAAVKFFSRCAVCHRPLS